MFVYDSSFLKTFQDFSIARVGEWLYIILVTPNVAGLWEKYVTPSIMRSPV